ncbi:LuxR family transcriptional regulator [Nocardioides sp. GY 10127]|uniref:LuxR family transcriptional regulator n=1 Tax=Nocardioides sp. GY 10127 TaxID=2569762 RepID=UPI0010A90B1D|nr:LuxR family transcriptional regulator [Nocardioides sp. GY 10127]TIC82692.1 LuxR family transcriptional regulator [Nocardioides sp. GY 10127]
MNGFGPEQRALFEKAAVPLYEDVLAAGGMAADDVRVAEGAAERPAFELLVELGLLQLDEAGERWRPEDPSTVQSRVVAPMNQESTRLLQESTEWARAFTGIGQAWRRTPHAEGPGPFTYLRDGAIGRFLTGLVADAETEILTAQPQAGRDAQTLAAAVLRDTAALERGVSLRTLYQHSARRSVVTAQYVQEVSARGAQVRTLDEFFNRMIVADRRIAVIPGAEDLRVAVAVREPSVVAYLVDVFERSWERGRPFANKETGTMRTIAGEQRAMTIRMLIEGHADPAAAKRVGVSPRTYAGYVADLKTEFEAETRFQLGWTMGRLGLTGGDDDPDPDASDQ